MRHLLGPFLLTTSLLLVGCGGPADDTAQDPAPSTASPSSGESTSGAPDGSESPEPSGTTDPGRDGEEVDFELVALVSGSAAGGRTAARATPLGSERAVQEFADQLTSRKMSARVARRAAGAQDAPGSALYGAIVSVGCDVPPGVTVTRTGAGVQITAKKVAKPLPECFAPVTTVALVTLDE